MTASRRRRLHEDGHKTEAPARDESGQLPGVGGVRRSFNEAAHKLGYGAPPAASGHARGVGGRRGSGSRRSPIPSAT